MKKNLLFILLSMFTMVGFGQQTLVVEFTTDGSPDESKWSLYNYSDEMVMSKSFYKSETTYFDTLELPNSNCYYLVITDTYGDGLAGSSGFDPGNYNVYLNNQLIITCEEPNFGSSISHYSIGVQCSSNDANALSLTLLKYISKDTMPVGVNVLNMGNEPITSVELRYSINDESIASALIEDLNILPGETKPVYHPKPYIFDTPEQINASATITKVNGITDANSFNNSKTQAGTVLNGILKKSMFELSSTAFYSGSEDANNKVDNTLSQFPGTYGHAKYCIEGWGDAKYVPENNYRFTEVYSQGVPFFWINGRVTRTEIFDSLYYEQNCMGRVSDFKLSIQPEFKGDSIYATIKLTSFIDFDTTIYLRGIATQHTAKENIPSRGYILHDAAYGYLPTPEGFVIEKLEAGKSYTFKTGINIQNFPLEEGSLTDMDLTFYLQMRKPFNKVLQSESVKLNYAEIKPDLNFNVPQNATNVDTTALQVELASNRTLYTSTGQKISNISAHVIMRLDNENGADVPTVVGLNESGNTIVIKNKYKWRAGKTYFVKVSNLGTLDQQAIADQTLTFTISNPNTAVDANKMLNAKVYPNPVSDYVSIETETEANITVFDVTGKPVLQSEKSSGRSVYKIAHLPIGIYFVQVNTTQGVKTFKLSRK